MKPILETPSTGFSDRRGFARLQKVSLPFCGSRTANRLSVGADSQTRILWNHVQGYQYLWSVNSSSSGGGINRQTFYANYPGWNSLSLATGRDNNTRLLCNHVNGQQIFWNMDSAFNILAQPGYGPYY